MTTTPSRPAAWLRLQFEVDQLVARHLAETNTQHAAEADADERVAA
jgi:hypothetical protein